MQHFSFMLAVRHAVERKFMQVKSNIFTEGDTTYVLLKNVKWFMFKSTV